MATQFNLVAQEYDQNRRRFIPCFDEFYRGATAFIAAYIAKPGRILDLGAGTRKPGSSPATFRLWWNFFGGFGKM